MLRFALVVTLLVLAGCGADTDSPRGTVAAFLKAAAAGDQAAAMAYVVADEQRDEPRFTPEGLRHGYSVGDAVANADQATVPVTVRQADGGERTMQMVCRRESGSWRVSIEETLRETFGAALRGPQERSDDDDAVVGDRHDQMQEHLQQTMQQMQESLERARRKAALPGR